MPELKIGGVAIKSNAVKDISQLVKNKEIFDKAQKRNQTVDDSSQKQGDWFLKLQESKEHFYDANRGKFPNLMSGEIMADP